VPRQKKAAGTAVDRRNGRQVELQVVDGRRFDLPDDVARGLLPQTTAAWDAYWEDPVAQVHTPADRAVLVSWIEALDRHTRLTRAADAEPLVTTSQGTSRNPLYAVAAEVWRTVAELQRQLGIGPANRVALGIAVASERRSLGDVNAAYGRAEQSTPSEREDPRLAPGGA
jgi:P27 family predicted phage terminase small subunit